MNLIRNVDIVELKTISMPKKGLALLCIDKSVEKKIASLITFLPIATAFDFAFP